MTGLDAITAVARRLLAWHPIGAWGFEDVLVWQERDEQVVVCLKSGNDLRNERSFLLPEMHPNRAYFLDADMQQHLGLAVEVQRGKEWQGFRSAAGQTMSEGAAHISEILEGLGTVIAAVMGWSSENLAVTLMSEHGTPWSETMADNRYYSALAQGWLKASPPKGMMRFKDREGKDAVGVHPCAVLPMVNPPQEKDLVLKLDDVPFFTTHCFGLDGRNKDAAVLVRDCGGLLCPSLALGHLPAFNYGPCCLFGSSTLALQGLKPFRRKGIYPVVLYDSDAWTPTTRQLLEDVPPILLAQLTGYYRLGVYGQPHWWTLGPLVETNADTMGGPVRIVKDLDHARRPLLQRFKVWQRDMSADDITRAQEGRYRYPYIEAKVAGVLPLHAFRLALVPSFWRDEGKEFLTTAGYNGPLLVMPATREEEKAFREGGKEADAVIWGWSWKVRDEVLRV